MGTQREQGHSATARGRHDGLIHRTTREHLTDYVDGTLGPGEWGRLRAHLVACRSCGAFARTFERMVVLVRQLPREPLPPETCERVLRRLMQRVAEAEASSSTRPS